MLEFIMSLATNMLIIAIWTVIFIVFAVIGAIIAGPTRFYKNEATGQVKVLRKGFSFTYYFFGFWVPMVRGDLVSFFIALAIDIFSLGTARFIYVFIINRTYVNKLLKDGYVEVLPNYVPVDGSDVIDVQ